MITLFWCCSKLSRISVPIAAQCESIGTQDRIWCAFFSPAVVSLPVFPKLSVPSCILSSEQLKYILRICIAFGPKQVNINCNGLGFNMFHFILLFVWGQSKTVVTTNNIRRKYKSFAFHLFFDYCFILNLICWADYIQVWFLVKRLERFRNNI